jgi:hypothetical protein
VSHTVAAVLVLLLVGSVFGAGAVAAFASLDRVIRDAEREERRRARLDRLWDDGPELTHNILEVSA